ncbi:MAG: amidohydrolase [Deltaproteobacteria bacterium]|nr:amidohydrolase [Deltaproteobacteria bacterium]MBW2385873.1 amidohydrolase [Deltaproteobacteria bacterium]
MGMPVDDLIKRSGIGRDHAKTVTFLPEPEPREVWATIFSVDDHVVEPPDIFDGRFSARFADDAPRVIETDDGGQAWLWQDQVLPNVGFNAVAGRPSEELSFEPTRFEHMRRGAWDVKARLHDMDLGGIWASVCFPSFLPGFVGQRLSLWPKDDALAKAAVRAYNSWHLEAWCRADPDRFVPQQIAYLRDAEEAAAEIRSNAALGFKAVTFSEAPFKLGLPTIHSGYWDPFFAACEETETVICLHVGSAGETPTTSPDAPPMVIGQLFAASGLIYAVDWLYSGVPVRFPKIKICMSEGGIGWVPGVIDRIENIRERDIVSDGSVDAELFRRNFWFCALNEPSGFRSVDVIGVDNILIESDYPHSDSTWPDTQPLLERHLAGLSIEEQRKICWQNATTLFGHTTPPSSLP